MEQRKSVEQRAVEYVSGQSKAEKEFVGIGYDKFTQALMIRAYRRAWHDCLAEVEERLHSLCNVRQVQEMIKEMKRP